MRIEVQLFATLALYLPPGASGGSATLDVPDGTTVQGLCEILGVPASMPYVALINGHDAEDDRRLAPDDVVTLFPPLAGGSAARARGSGRPADGTLKRLQRRERRGIGSV